MIYALTSKYLEDTDRNFATVSSYLAYDIAAQLKTPTGHAVTPIPVTEALRIPLPEEIAQIQLVAHQVEQSAADLCDVLDWDKMA